MALISIGRLKVPDFGQDFAQACSGGALDGRS
jgi:hypothetical protein